MYQKLILIGNLGKDVELKTTDSGAVIGKFSLATSKKVKGESVSSWHNIIVFNKTAELCAKYIGKGSKVMIEGEISYRTYEKDGEKKYFTEIIGNNVQFLDSKGESQKTVPAPEFDTTSIPF